MGKIFAEKSRKTKMGIREVELHRSMCFTGTHVAARASKEGPTRTEAAIAKGTTRCAAAAVADAQVVGDSGCRSVGARIARVIHGL
jgi:hypothetical protein